MGKELEFTQVNIEQTPQQETTQQPVQQPVQETVQPAEEPKKRGRKKGIPNKKNPEKPDSEFDFFEEAKKAASQKASETITETKPAIEVVSEQPSLVTGYMLLVICDAVIPKIVGSFIAKRTGKKAAVKKMDKEQIKEMQPLADAAAKKMFSGVSEVPAFFIAYGCITLTNNIE